MEQDARQSDAEGTHQFLASSAFEREREGFRDEASSTELVFSSGEDALKPTDRLTQFPTMPIFVLLCIIMIVVALVATPIFVLLCVIMIFIALVASLVLSFRY
jgi:Flp pilus assembly protein TadB